MNAELIAIGSELLTPSRVDTNSAWLTEQLNAVGISIRMRVIVGDDEQPLEEALRDAIRRSDVVITTGGLGPTEDDITRKVVSRVLGRPLVLDDAVLQDLRERFERYGVRMTPNNERQALVIRDAEVLPNPNGTAPGQLARTGHATVVLLPGPPREMKPMFTEHVLPKIVRRGAGICIRRRVLKTTGHGESTVDQKIAPIYGKYTNPSTTILHSAGEVEIHLTAHAEEPAAAERMLDELAGQIEEALAPAVFSHAGETLEEVVGRGLTVRGLTVATAESCTGGLIAKRLTDLAGSSKFFKEGAVTYSNEAKTRQLGVPAATIERNGAVSREVAEAMAIGIKRASGATIGLSVTGVAGPGGGTETKPVGLVFVGLADDVQVEVKELRLFGSRDEIRLRASQAALELVRRRFLL